jgi:alpha-glucosidase
MKPLRNLKLGKIDASSVTFETGNHLLQIYILEEDIVRVLVKRNGDLMLPKTWSIEWEREVPIEGRDRLDIGGFARPTFRTEESAGTFKIVTKKVELRIELAKARLEWWSNGFPVLSERATGSMYLSAHDEKLEHHFALTPGAQMFGLGEAAGPLSRRGKRIQFKNVDAMGYDAETTDPLYKHFPFLIHRDRGVAVGLYYDCFATSVFDCGKEIDNYHGPFFSYRAEAGDLDYYLMLGPTIREVTKKFTKLTGRPMMPPKWSLKYSGSTMTYTDAPNAQEALSGFLAQIEKHDLSCGSFHLSSGYTSIGKRRYVFNWNRDKFPDAKAIVDAFAKEGVRFIPNIKPVLLEDHPFYGEAKAHFVKDSESAEPELSQFWDGMGSHLDFTNPKTISWWKKKATESLLSLGIEALWNDNNEFEVWDDEAKCNGFGKPWPIKLGRPIQTLLMAMASRQALIEAKPNRRPFVVSRSGMPGMQRYNQTWSGDNFTDWKTLRFNSFMALNLGLSGVGNTGHDVGGFAGPRPSPELFLRWIQNGIFYPRFVIHSWKSDGVNEPWMYPELVPAIRKLFRLRETLSPYFYQVLKRAHDQFEPFLRPLFFDFETDANSFGAHDAFMVGPDLLVANVFDEGIKQLEVYLPENAGGWFDFHTGKHFVGGLKHDLKVELESVPMFVRAGSALPLATPEGIEWRVYSDPKAKVQSTYFDDDGETFPFRERDGVSLRLEASVVGEIVHAEISKSGEYLPELSRIRVSHVSNKEVKIGSKKTDVLDVASL